MIFLTKMADAGVLAMRIAIPMNVAHLQILAGFIRSIAHAMRLSTVVLMQAKCICSRMAVVYVDLVLSWQHMASQQCRNNWVMMFTRNACNVMQ